MRSRVYISMLRAVAAASLAALMAIVVSCTQNNGHIGPYFGSWLLDEIIVDGTPVADYDDTVMISFQSSVFNMSSLNGQGIYGGWEESDGHVILTGATDSGNFPPEVGFGKETKIDMTILKMSSKHMEWQRTATDGAVWVYKFRKLL